MKKRTFCQLKGGLCQSGFGLNPQHTSENTQPTPLVIVVVVRDAAEFKLLTLDNSRTLLFNPLLNFSLTETIYADYSLCLNVSDLISSHKQDERNKRDYLQAQHDPGLVDGHYSCRLWRLSTFSDITNIKPFYVSHFRTLSGIQLCWGCHLQTEP